MTGSLCQFPFFFEGHVSIKPRPRIPYRIWCFEHPVTSSSLFLHPSRTTGSLYHFPHLSAEDNSPNNFRVNRVHSQVSRNRRPPRSWGFRSGRSWFYSVASIAQLFARRVACVSPPLVCALPPGGAVVPPLRVLADAVALFATKNEK